MVEEFSKSVKALLQNNLLSIKLFGSKARLESTGESDVDILIVLKNRDFATVDKIYKLLFDLDPYYEHRISLSIFSEEEYRKNEQLGSFFIENLNREAVAI